MSTEGDYQTPFGYSLHYRLDGNGAEKILLVIGFSSCGQYWGPLVDAIHSKYPGRYTTCIYDQRGVGKSTTRVLEKFSSRTIARDILGLLLHLGWIGRHIPLHLISWSMGGFGSIEFVNLLLKEVESTLNISSLTLCNTGYKFAFPAARSLIPGFTAIGKGILSVLFGIPSKWFIPEILLLHYSRSFLSDPVVYADLMKAYETRSPFNAPLGETTIAIFQHLYAVLTHYVPSHRMEAIRTCGLPMHAVVSTEDALIHPTASITLARKLDCEFSYLPGGHMSHVEHTDIVIEKLVAIWDVGLSKKFPHFRKPDSPLANPFSRTKSQSVSFANDHDFTGPSQLANWSEPETIVKLNQLVRSRIDKWGFESWRQRLRQPGRLVLGPAIVLPIVLIQLRKVFCKSKSKREKATELGILIYIFALMLVVQEVTRENG
jgi:pimeloyl-ACP methyl ester carboxylesterase